MTEARDNKTFEAKVSNLIATTRHLEVPHILMLRRLTLSDPESLKWANERQLNVVFNVLVTKALERMDKTALIAARDGDYKTLVMPGKPEAQAEDLRVVNAIATQMIGPKPKPAAIEAEHGNSLAKLLSLSPTAPGEKVSRTVCKPKEPPPLFAAQLGPDSERMMPSANSRSVEGSEERPFSDFKTLFDDTLSAYSRNILALFSIQGAIKGGRPPFPLAPEFGRCYEEVLRRYVLPPMHASRHIQQLGMSYNWAEVGGAKLIDIIGSGDHNNPVLHNWDTRWGAMRAPKGKKPKPEENPWPLFREDATNGNYDPPTEEHLQLLQDFIRFEVEAIAKAWREISQLYEQEFAPSGRQEQAREGAFRDGLMRWSAKLPDHVGEFLAIKSYFMFPNINGNFIRRLLTNFGRTDSERYRQAPFLAGFAQTVPE
ncbi:hypothetical protein [Magnetospirillum moscoviense]|uniref:Uncharacterized protein n=1 Tax=Magnetospirillum moscoviense TaxID=1437059 RepID=A0A178MM84_9PROT|nr:hypothetical protein [Magnetospirillum moscoviense]MBF0326952.1 hypothetical protein [Alphaproteobacteria bacterium]OAN49643.1 hypothetical protein A6A05_13215 [Magnetospirillum moscoviense]